MLLLDTILGAGEGTNETATELLKETVDVAAVDCKPILCISIIPSVLTAHCKIYSKVSTRYYKNTSKLSARTCRD